MNVSKKTHPYTMDKNYRDVFFHLLLLINSIIIIIILGLSDMIG
jgi:hypothetical protein